MQSVRERLERWLGEEGLGVVVHDDPKLELSMGIVHMSGVQFTIVQEKGRPDKITLYLSMAFYKSQQNSALRGMAQPSPHNPLTSAFYKSRQ
ncbi:MAG: hypothetical protein PWP01_1393, partial [Methanosarcinales archaeon]|nr:hypothetical protein [Methanosarcinales archaeon]